MIRILFIFAITFFTIKSYGLDLIFKNYSLDNGLPSSEVHDIYQDAHGYMWFATDRGIARFDGKEFLVLNTDNKLPENCVFNFFEQSPTKVWIATKTNNLFCFNPLGETFQFYEYPFNKELRRQFGGEYVIEFIRKIWIENDNIYTSFLTGVGFVKVDNSGTGSLNKRLSLTENSHLFCDIFIHINTTPGEEYCYSEFISKKSEDRESRIYLIDESFRDTIFTGLSYTFKFRWQYGISDFRVEKDESYFILGRYFFRYDKTRKIRVIELPAEGLKMRCFNDKFFVSTFSGCYHYNEDGILIDSYLPNNIVTDVFIDQNEGIWLSTLEEGIYYAKSLRFYTFGSTQRDKVVPRGLIIDSVWVLCATEDNHVLVYNHQGSLIDQFDRISYSHGFFMTDSPGLEKYLGDARDHKYLTDKFVYNIKFRQEKALADVNGKGVTIHLMDSVITGSLPVPFMNNYLPKNDTVLYVGTDSGLYEVYNYWEAGPSKLGQKYAGIPMRIMIDFMNGLLIATKESGLIYLKEDYDLHITKETGLISNTITDLKLADSNVVWIGTPSGLMRFEWDLNENRFNIDIVDQSDGLTKGEVLCVEPVGDTIWVGTKRGIFLFPDDDLIYSENLRSEHFFMDSILVNAQKIVNHGDTIQVSYGDFAELFFRQISLRNDEGVKYAFRFRDNDQWQLLGTNIYAFKCNTPGYTSVHIKPVDQDYEMKIVIYTSYPFWYQWWFYLLAISIIVLLSWLSAKIIVIRKTRKKESEIKKLKLEMQSLLSQMNPHFTFNTINSIQYYLINNNTKDAVLYLADFALLIRKTLGYSRNEFISLREELDFLKLYTDLENKRFNYGFEVLFDVKLLRTEDEIRFPSLLIQPVVENAIIHGVSKKKKGEGKIKVSIHETEKYFEIIVSDNGNGIENKKSVLERQSYGMDILRNRLRLYNGKYFNESDILVSNLGENKGLIVKIKLYKTSYDRTDS